MKTRLLPLVLVSIGLAACNGESGSVPSSSFEIDARVTYGGLPLEDAQVYLDVQAEGPGNLTGYAIGMDSNGRPILQSAAPCSRSAERIHSTGSVEGVPQHAELLRSTFDSSVAFGWAESADGSVQCGYLSGRGESHSSSWDVAPAVRVRARIPLSAGYGSDLCRPFAIRECEAVADSVGCLADKAEICLDALSRSDNYLVSDWVEAPWHSDPRAEEGMPVGPVLQPGDPLPSSGGVLPAIRADWLEVSLELNQLEFSAFFVARLSGVTHTRPLHLGESVRVVTAQNLLAEIVAINVDETFVVQFADGRRAGYSRDVLARTEGCGLEFCTSEVAIQFVVGRGTTAVEVVGLVYDGRYVVRVTQAGGQLGQLWTIPAADLAKMEGCGAEYCVGEAAMQFVVGRGSTPVRVVALASTGHYICEVTAGSSQGQRWILPVSDLAKMTGCSAEAGHCVGDQLLQFARGGATLVQVVAITPTGLFVSRVLEGSSTGDRWTLPASDLAVREGCATGEGNHCIGETGYFNSGSFSSFEVVGITTTQTYLIRWLDGSSAGRYAGPYTAEQLIFGGARP